MKILISLLPLFLINISLLAQFDRINLDPVSSNPSFVGSIKKARIAFKGQYQFDRQSNSQISYDFFSSKLKGGWGVSAQFMKTFLYSSEYQEYNLSYSPKLTFNNTGGTWAPSVRVSYHRNTHGTDVSDKKALGFTLGFNRNTNKSLAGGYIEINPYGKWMEYALNYSYKFNKNRFKDISSTLFISSQLNYAYVKDISMVNYGFDSGVANVYLSNRWRFMASSYDDSFNYVNAEDHVNMLLSYTYRRERLSVGVESAIFLARNPNKIFSNSFTSPNFEVGYQAKNIEILVDLNLFFGNYFRTGVIYKFGKK